MMATVRGDVDGGIWHMQPARALTWQVDSCVNLLMVLMNDVCRVAVVLCSQQEVCCAWASMQQARPRVLQNLRMLKTALEGRMMQQDDSGWRCTQKPRSRTVWWLKAHDKDIIEVKCVIAASLPWH